MKKPANPKAGTSKTGRPTPEKPARAPRHAKKTARPVTIELEAETVATKGKQDTAATEKKAPTQRGASVPKSTTKKADTGTRADNISGSRANADEAAEKTKATTSTPPPGSTGSQPVNPGSRRSNSFVAALIGGAVALGGGGLLQYAGLLPAFGPVSGDYVSNDLLQQSTSKLDSRLSELERGNVESSAQLEERLSKKIAELAATNTETGGSATVETAARLAELEGGLSETKTALDALKETISSGAAGEGAGLKALTEQISALNSELEGLKRAAEKPQAESAGLLALQTAVPALEATVNDKIGALGNKLARIEETTTLLNQKADANAGAGEALAALERSVDEVKSRAEEQKTALNDLMERSKNGADRKTAQALAAAALKSRIDQGLPYRETLQTLKAVAADADFSALESSADSGIPTLAALGESFSGVSDEILLALAPKKDGDAVSRLLSGAKGLIKVKPLGPVDGDTPVAILSRIGAALQANDLQKASDEWNSLPDAGKAASSDWHNDLLARLSANNLLSETVQTFLLSQ